MKLRAITFNKEFYREPLKTNDERATLNIQLYLPPTDVPDFLESNYDEKKDNLHIFFVYPDKEKKIEKIPGDNFQLNVAHSSGKPLEIIINDIKKQQIDKVELKQIIHDDIGKLIHKQLQNLQNIRKRTNLEHIDKILKLTSDALVQTAPV